MGGEWWFILEKKENFDLVKYQELLKNIKDKFKSANFGEDVQITWFEPDESKKEPTDNIFGSFTYKCKKFGCEQHKRKADGTKAAAWYLYWDPTTVENSMSDLHARCADHYFRGTSVEIQKMLTTEFPANFQLYLGDDITGGPEGELAPQNAWFNWYDDDDSDDDFHLLC